MSRSNQQLARLVQELIRAVRTGRIKMRWVVGLAVIALGYFLVQPVLERSLGIDLPGLDDMAANTQSSGGPSANRPDAKEVRVTSSGELAKILSSRDRADYRSAAGLRYTPESQHGHRLKHLMAHCQDEPGRPGQHGVFDSNDAATVVALVDEAYLQAQTGRDTRTQREEDRIVYDVNLRKRIGYVGGSSGKRKGNPPARHIRLVIQGDRLITAFPIVP